MWPANKTFFDAVRSEGGLIGIAVDPLTSHECGNQRYLAIPWLDACLTTRLPTKVGEPLEPMPTGEAWLAEIGSDKATAAVEFQGNPKSAIWLPNEAIANAWMQYVKDTSVSDTSPPPAPTNLVVKGNQLSWIALQIEFQ